MAISVAGVDANLRKEALFQLASTDLLELCHEAKVEHCRATRDLGSCGRNVQHVLSSCKHASLCAECSQRCDTCPVCRTSLPKSGNKLYLRLFNKCVEAGLISKKYDERSENLHNREHLDIQRLYSLFDVALENNLVSLVCHYVTDVCLDEGAVSSDPVLAFLLDEIVVKNWCKWKYKNIMTDLLGIYVLGIEGMEKELNLLLKLSSHLNGIANVLEVLESSFAGVLSTELADLHLLSENTLKAKQHLEVMIWCIRHKFLESVESRHPDLNSWNLHVNEKKSAAIKRTWPYLTNKPAELAVENEATLFIEDALSNLDIVQDLGVKGLNEFDAGFLCADSYQLLDPSVIVGVSGLYPFKNLRTAADILFLHGTSDMVVAKQAIFLYFLFDRHWTMPDVFPWRHIVEDFAASFGISRHSLLESLVFFLLDDHSEEAIHQASKILPEIAGPQTHPKIAKVLLERQSPDVALMVLRCSGHDGFSTNAILKSKDLVATLSEAVTSVRVRVECGLLTEAFVYQRIHCSHVKEDEGKHGHHALSDGAKDSIDSWMHHTEVLVTEICFLCMRRNLVDRMIELPWNSDEEVFLYKCLFDIASQQPSSTSGSLLVVFYLQRCRYIEAYQIDHKLQELEKEFFQIASEKEISRTRTISQWRAGLVKNCIDLLPDVRRAQLISGDLIEKDTLHSRGSPADPKLLNSTSLLASSSMKPSDQVDIVPLLKKAPGFMNTRLSYSVGSVGFEQLDTIFHQKSTASHRSPMVLVQGTDKNHLANVHYGEPLSSVVFFNGEGMQKNAIHHQFRQVGDFIQGDVGSHGTPSILKPTKMTLFENNAQFQDGKILFGADLPDLNDHTEERRLSSRHKEYVQNPSDHFGTVYRNGFPQSSYHSHVSTGTARVSPGKSWPSVPLEEGDTNFQLRSDKRENSEEVSTIGGLRWRSDESSDDETRLGTFMGSDVSSVKRRSRYGRR